MVLRIVLICLIVFVLLSLFQALFSMMRASPEHKIKMVRALSVRIGLSLALFLLLLLGWANGWWMPHRIG